MTVLRAQTSGSASSKASGGSQASRIDCRRVSPPRGRKVHALVRGSSQREVLAGQTPQVHCSVNTKRQGGSTAQSKPPIKGKRQHAAAQEQGYAWVPLVAATTVPLLIAAPAWAAYSPTEGEQALKTVAGAAYIILVCFFFYRLIRKRAYTGVTQNFRSKANELAEEPEEEIIEPAEVKDATPLTALWGAFQAGVICYFLFQLCGLVDGYFDRQEMPDQYTAHNITVTLRTVIRGLAYLMTFLFGANCVGLSGLAVQLAFFPEADAQKDVKQE